MPPTTDYPLSELRTRRRIEFADTDMGARVHFEYEGRAVGWPRIEASCRYASPVRLGDWLDIRLRVARKGKRSMAYSFSFRCEGRLIARGRVASVCCLLDEPAGLKAIPIPRFLAKRIAVDSSA